jgi:zinc D-Ala-D-Ala carboxypeptidase
MTQLSQHFSYEEFTRSVIAIRRGLDNTPDQEALANLHLLAAAMENVRALLGVPIHVDSAYRSPKVNAALGGSANSAHMRGLACDFTAVAFGTPQQVARAIVDSDIDFDQVIFEGDWVHFAIGDNMRKQVLTAHFNGGKATYTAGIPA